MENNKKKKSTLLRDALALFLITLFSGLALSYVYEITKAPINDQIEMKGMKANQAVFVTASTFEEDADLMKLAADTDLTTLSNDYKGITIDKINQALDKSNQIIGYNITVTTKQSYKDSITLVVGYSMDKVIQGIEITSISETAGLGMNAKKPAFIHQYLNKKVDKFTVTKTGATEDNQIDALSGATITSRAVTNAINAGIGFLSTFATASGGAK